MEKLWKQISLSKRVGEGKKLGAVTRFWEWIKVHPVVLVGVAIFSFISAVIPLSGNLQVFLEWTGLRRPYYGLYTGDVILSTVVLLEGQHFTFSLQGGYPGDSAKVSIFGDRCIWTISKANYIYRLSGDSCALSSDRILSDAPLEASLVLTLSATNSESRKLVNPDGSNSWSTTLIRNMPRGTAPPPQLANPKKDGDSSEPSQGTSDQNKAENRSLDTMLQERFISATSSDIRAIERWGKLRLVLKGEPLPSLTGPGVARCTLDASVVSSSGILIIPENDFVELATDPSMRDDQELMNRACLGADDKIIKAVAGRT